MAEHCLENQFLKITVSDHGAELCSVYDKEEKKERIWNADPAVWNRHAPLLFPFVGRVIGNVYRYQGKEYEMPFQHGFARDMEFTLVEKSETHITHCLEANEETRKMYPFAFRLFVTHRLDQTGGRKLLVKWTICNDGKEEMYYSIGAHPAFMLPEGGGFLLFPEKEQLTYIQSDKKSGFARPDLPQKLFLQNGFLPLEKALFDKGAYVFEHGQIKSLSITKPDRMPYVTMECPQFPMMGIWSPAGSEAFVCLEPWFGRVDDEGFTGELKEKPGEQELEAGGTREISYSMTFCK